MPRASLNGVELEYDTFGSSDDPAIVCIAGLGAQLITFHEDFCRGLVPQFLRHLLRKA